MRKDTRDKRRTQGGSSRPLWRKKAIDASFRRYVGPTPNYSSKPLPKIDLKPDIDDLHLLGLPKAESELLRSAGYNCRSLARAVTLGTVAVACDMELLRAAVDRWLEGGASS